MRSRRLLGAALCAACMILCAFPTMGQLVCPGDITVQLNPFECEATVNYNTGSGGIQTDVSGLSSGDAFPIGITYQEWSGLDISGAPIACGFNIEVIEFSNSGALTCSHDINVSVDQNCEVLVTADMLLSGNYGCINAFDVTVYNGPTTGHPILSTSPLITDIYCGETLAVKITNGVNNSCWGLITLEDKSGPIINCPADTMLSCVEFEKFLHSPFAPEATAVDNCGQVVSISYVDEDHTNICGGFVNRIWIAEDEKGNTSTCVQTITSVLNGPPTITAPRDLTLSCPVKLDDFSIDALQDFINNASNPYLPHPYPGANDTDYCGSVAWSYTDQVFNVCMPYGFKIQRNWSALDWCRPTWDTSFIQYLKAVDDEAPSLTCPGDLTISTIHNTCLATVPSSPNGVYMSDNCDTDPQISLVTLFDEFGFQLPGFTVGPGTYKLRYIAEDACGNQGACDRTVIVTDFVAPVAICDQNTIMSITSDGWADLCYTTIDDGSYDNCGGVTIEIRIPTSNSAVHQTWQDCHRLRCAQVGSHTIEMRVEDDFGNVNYCWANLDLENKLPPDIICPPDVTIACIEDFTNLSLTGDVIAYNNITIPSSGNGAAWGGCGTPDVAYTDSAYPSCTGTFVRTWSASKWVTTDNDTGPELITVTCDQLITVTDDTPASVTFPEDVTIDCGMSIDTSIVSLAQMNYTDASGVYHFFDYPQLVQDCEQLGVSRSDEMFDICLPAGFEIERTWHVIDWCDPDFDEYHTQMVKVADTQVPEIIVDNVSVPILNNDPNCQTYVSLDATTTDDCSAVTVTHDSPYADAPGTDASGVYPKGLWTVTFTAVDDCGNVRAKSVTVHVFDKKAPAIACLNISVELTASGEAIVTPDMLDNGSNDNCTIQPNLFFLLERVDANDNPIAPQDDEAIFDCDDRVHLAGVQYVRLWVFDGPPNNSNGDYCLSQVTVTDNGMDPGCAASANTAMLSGFIQDQDGQDIDNATILLDGNPVTPVFPGFEVWANTNQMHTVGVEKDNDLLNGVSTFDIVLLRKHLLNVNMFTNPYQWIAGDINKSGTISTIDIVELRKAILTISTSFPNGNTSWRFIDADYTFTTSNPLTEPYNETISMMLMSNITDADFIGVKIGDVSGDALPNTLTNTSQRNTDHTKSLSFQDLELKAGKHYNVPLEAEDVEAILGMQMSMNFDPTAIHMESLECNLLGFNESMYQMGSGTFTLSWDNPAQEAKSDKIKLYLNFKAVQDGLLSEVLTMNQGLNAEYYNHNLNKISLDLVAKPIQDLGFLLEQNIPNPFKQSTKIGFTIPEADDVELVLRDLSGRVVWSSKVHFTEGYNEYIIHRNELFANATGLFYYTISTGTHTATKKMFITE